MSKKWLIWAGIIVAIVAGLAVYIGALKAEINKLHTEITQERAKFEELEEGLVRSESELVTEREFRRLLEETFGEQLSAIEADLKQIESEIADMLAEVTE